MMDGSLEADAKIAGDSYEYNVDDHRARGATWLTGSAPRWRANSACSARSKAAKARGRGRPRLRRASSAHDQLLTDPDQAVDFVRSHKGRRAGNRHAAPRTAPTSSRASPTGDDPGDERDRGDPRQAAERAPGHARLLGSVPQELQDVINEYRRRHAADVRRAGRGRCERRHPARCAQGQHRHRLPHGDDRPVPQSRCKRTIRAEFDPRKFLKPARGRHARALQATASSEFGTAGQRLEDQGDPDFAKWPSATPPASSTPVSRSPRPRPPNKRSGKRAGLLDTRQIRYRRDRHEHGEANHPHICTRQG